MTRRMKVGMHVVFIDSYRKERDALVTAIHGDEEGRMVIPVRKSPRDLTEEEKASGLWEVDSHGIYAYKHDENGLPEIEYREPGQHWPCINLVVVSENKDAQDQYGRQIDERPTSVVHWKGNSAHGYCFRFADEEVDHALQQPTVS